MAQRIIKLGATSDEDFVEMGVAAAAMNTNFSALYAASASIAAGQTPALVTMLPVIMGMTADQDWAEKKAAAITLNAAFAAFAAAVATKRGGGSIAPMSLAYTVLGLTAGNDSAELSNAAAAIDANLAELATGFGATFTYTNMRPRFVGTPQAGSAGTISVAGGVLGSGYWNDAATFDDTQVFSAT